MAFVFAAARPSWTIFLKAGLLMAYLTVFIWQPLLDKNYIAVFSRFPERGGSSLRLMRQVRYFLWSPMAMALERQGSACLI
jgi:hypothetical protein